MSHPNPKKRLKAHQVTLYSFLAVGLVTLVLSLTWWNTHRVCESNIHRLAQALESYKTTHGDYPMNHRQLVPDYLDTMPKCPTLDIDTYRVAFGRGAGYGDPKDEDYYIIRCTGMEHTFPDGFPAYDKIHGMMYLVPGEDQIREGP